MQVQEVEQPVDVHGRHAMQVHQEVPLIVGDMVQDLQEHPARVLTEFTVGADQDRVAAALNAHVDQIFLLPSPAGTALRVSIARVAGDNDRRYRRDTTRPSAAVAP
ncbi:hypothetical protein ACFVQ9_17135 [Streptomyces goshikiensis]|uniref:hypothetical protein n=1 Tax=Streptomyces goshikiensis TaxID=1942 RepID=UPI003683A4B3